MRNTRPNPENQRDALAVLADFAGHPVTTADAGWDKPRPTRRSALERPCEATASALLREIAEGDPMDRRRFTHLTGAAATAPALFLLMGGPNPLHAAAEEGERLPPRLVDSISSAVRELRDLDDTTGSTSGLLWAGGLWQSTARVLANSATGSADDLRLRTTFIELSETYGWMLFDSNRQTQAQRVYQAGMRLATETDDNRDKDLATRNLLASTAYQASWLGRHDDARTLLDVAEKDAHRLPPLLRAVIADRRIFAAGRSGDTETLRRARDIANEHLLDTTAERPWFCAWLSAEAIDAATGRAWLAANEPDHARAHLERRAAATATAYPRDALLAQLDLADAHRLRGDIDASATCAMTALQHGNHVRSPRATARVREITTHLRPHAHHPHVRELITALAI